jgi:hypothetical protein
MLSITVMMAYFGNTTRRNQSDMPLRYFIFTVKPNPVNNGNTQLNGYIQRLLEKEALAMLQN